MCGQHENSQTVTCLPAFMSTGHFFNGTEMFQTRLAYETREGETGRERQRQRQRGRERQRESERQQDFINNQISTNPYTYGIKPSSTTISWESHLELSVSIHIPCASTTKLAAAAAPPPPPTPCFDVVGYMLITGNENVAVCFDCLSLQLSFNLVAFSTLVGNRS